MVPLPAWTVGGDCAYEPEQEFEVHLFCSQYCERRQR